jgi:hypothetical protein
MTGEAEHRFTVAAVERLIPRLEALMARIMTARGEGSRLRGELEAAQRAIALAGGSRLRQEWWRTRKAAMDQANREVRTRLREIVATGGVPTDLELGLVDFPGRVRGREVHLCWRYGEKRVRFWHGTDEGYAARKPIPEDECQG